ncbi:MAG: RNA methyltransferase [Nevskiaceae bacterium]|nr:MAG: RNA methyltransferase [Nevskiaceae bacterium]TBR73675.1 MAG: RNA methyltransferase [Nevskiaceae bacterium]
MDDSPRQPQPADSAVPTVVNRTRIVLVRPQHPGNIGSTARAMKNMGLRDLVLVQPRKFPHAQATALAAGAADLLEQARIVETLPEALTGCVHVAGTTARSRYLSQPVYTPREWVARCTARVAEGPVALLFGCERTGLTNEELDEAQELVSIPVDAAYPSLNLAQAVQVMCYELHQGQPAALATTVRDVVPQLEMDRFYGHLERTLVLTEFLDPANPRFLMRRLRLLFGRLEPNANEMNILRGILTSVETRIHGHDKALR